MHDEDNEFGRHSSWRRHDRVDPLAPAKGLRNAFILGLILWGLLGAAWVYFA